MKDKIYLSVIVLLVLAVVISFTVEDAETAELKDKVADMEKLEKTNADLKKETNNIESNIQDLRTDLAMNAAAVYKRKQYTVDYVKDYKATYSQQIDGLDEYVTNKGRENLLRSTIMINIYQLSFETKSNLSVKDITFEVGESESKNEISLDYDIEIVIDPVSNDGKKRTATNFGQLRVVKTEDGWKVEKDIDRMNGTGVLMEEFKSE
ncbi:hypothetical protein [Virgibacillus doumboii]|uniref:hypothetical protein n=1 Tax=Virgibacillus doumboii TaxID=2697503 RepID=UPI0013E083EF|nr:hypothetical protein [Virgibacillus doumboii]